MFGKRTQFNFLTLIIGPTGWSTAMPSSLDFNHRKWQYGFRYELDDSESPIASVNRFWIRLESESEI